jgi:hypothetical protein
MLRKKLLQSSEAVSTERELLAKKRWKEVAYLQGAAGLSSQFQYAWEQNTWPYVFQMERNERKATSVVFNTRKAEHLTLQTEIQFERKLPFIEGIWNSF